MTRFQGSYEYNPEQEPLPGEAMGSQRAGRIARKIDYIGPIDPLPTVQYTPEEIPEEVTEILPVSGSKALETEQIANINYIFYAIHVHTDDGGTESHVPTDHRDTQTQGEVGNETTSDLEDRVSALEEAFASQQELLEGQFNQLRRDVGRLQNRLEQIQERSVLGDVVNIRDNQQPEDREVRRSVVETALKSGVGTGTITQSKALKRRSTASGSKVRRETPTTTRQNRDEALEKAQKKAKKAQKKAWKQKTKRKVVEARLEERERADHKTELERARAEAESRVTLERERTRADLLTKV